MFGFGGRSSLLPSAFAIALALALALAFANARAIALANVLENALAIALAIALAVAFASALGARANRRRRKGRDVADTAGRGVRGPYRKSAARRRAIIEAAAVVFARSGYRGATIRDIAAEAGISPSSLLHFYRTKQELLWAT